MNTATNPVTSLYVADLHPEVNEAMLFEKFSSFGPILSIRVCRDMVTRRSLGYAYVNFREPCDAEKAMDTLNFDVLKGSQIRIMLATGPKSLSPDQNVFIKNLDKSIDNKALYDTFSMFGDICSCKIACDEKGSKGYGFVQFTTEEAASQCVEKANGKIVFVGQFKSAQKEETQTDDKECNVFTKNFGDELDDEKLETMFGEFGKIESAKVMVDSNNKSKGFGFVHFEESEAAQKAVEALHKAEINGRVLICGYFKERAELEAIKLERSKKCQGVNLYVKNLGFLVDDEKLREEFSMFGTITSAKVMCKDGMSKGFGFVCFSSPEEATKAITVMNGRFFGCKPLYVALAQRKEDRQDSLKRQHLQGQQKTQSVPIYSAGGGGCFAPTLPQAQRGFFTPANMPSIRPPRPPWGANVRPGQTAISYPGYPPMSGQVRPRPPQNQAQLRPTSGNSRPIVGHSVAEGPAGAGQRGVAMADMARSGAAAGMQAQQGARAYQGMRPQNQQSMVVAGQDPLTLTATMLAAAPPQEQKQMLGERLFPIIQGLHPDLAGKITGMLLDIDNSELLHMLESQESLKMKVEEAVEILRLKSKCENHEDSQKETDKMNNPIVRAALKMDISEKLIKLAIEKRMSESGEEFDSPEALIEAVFSLDLSESDKEVESGKENDASGGPSSERQAEMPSSCSSDENTNKSSEESAKLMEEIRRLKEQHQCKICMDEDVSIAFRPCGHLVCCATCAPALKICPICRGKIKGSVRTYLS